MLNQRAYQATRISLTAPTLNISQVMVAIAFGILVLGEQVGSSVGVITGELVGLAVAALPTNARDTDTSDVPLSAARN